MTSDHQRVDAAHAAAVLAANGSTLPPGVADAGGYRAYLFPDRDTAEMWHRIVVSLFGTTLIGFGNVEGGWLYLYDLRADQRRAS